MKRFAKLGLTLLFTAAVAALLLLAKPIAESVRGGIDICLKVLVPSLFAFMVLADFSVKTGMLDLLLRPFGWLCGKLFRIDRSLGPVVLMSLIGGYPVGAKLLTDFVLEGRMAKRDAERMLCFCVNSGPAFVIGSVAVPLFGDTKLGFLIFASHLTAFFAVGILSGLGKPSFSLPLEREAPPYSTALVNSVASATRAMVNICSFVLVFSALIGLLRLTGVLGALGSFLGSFLPRPVVDALLIGVLEVTNGTNACAGISGTGALLAATALTAFGGLCVQMQVTAIVSRAKLSMKPFYKFRLLYTAVSTLTAWGLLQLFEVPVSTMATPGGIPAHLFSFSPLSSLFLLILCILLLCTARKSVTIECKPKMRRKYVGK